MNTGGFIMPIGSDHNTLQKIRILSQKDRVNDIPNTLFDSKDLHPLPRYRNFLSH